MRHEHAPESYARDADHLDRLITESEAARRFAEEVCPPDADGQVQRVAQRFGFVAAAGWLACRIGILPWSSSAPFGAARRVFHEWLDQRGGAGSAEAIRAVRLVRRFVEQHGESRFTRWDAPADRPTINRAGFRREHGGRTEFLFHREMLQHEVLAGLDFSAALRALRDAGCLIADAAGKSSCSVRVPGLGRSIRLYRVDADALLGDDGVANA